MNSPIFINVLFWLHLMALTVGMGGGIAMSRLGPRLVAATPDQRAPLFPLAAAYHRFVTGGFVLLLITGPAILWLKYGGLQGLNHWFELKMALVLAALIAFGVSHVGLSRLKRGDESGGKLMTVAGPLTGLSIAGVVFAAVFTFN